MSSEKTEKKKKTKKAEGDSSSGSGKTKKRAQRATSNVFSMFDQRQVQEFKEAFTLIDQDRDGFISKEDLAGMFDSLGRTAKDTELDEMLSEAPGPLNFTMFLQLFGERFSGSDPEDAILNAFKLFDPEATGAVDAKKLKELIQGIGDRFDKKEVEQLFQNAPVTKGKFDYKAYAHTLTHGEEELEQS
ncbi:PREDICTED: myosin regulatory light chain 2, ventricular/cardiac muscle isoform-like [Priapulus caudatus]|uniref:Myosin regulatory light chain 2, ventricular/cardiac muscle isoform-like n=1 Tax=Priapulus caudatus TaxID=37621 RepID=A0ABM1EFU7_PRICU|nr:PREDICTED: myosin regulatory light chain 2, ventricular/cardiac muscle isoform-like [Priapulus caudatus]